MTRRQLLSGILLPGALVRRGLAEPHAGPIEGMAQRIFEKTNELRRARGARELLWSDALSICARQQCERKKALRFSGHEDPELGGVAERLSMAGIRWASCAENLFELRGYEDPVDFAIVFWWYSAGHQANMINPAYQRTGVAVSVDAEDRFFVTQIFVQA